MDMLSLMMVEQKIDRKNGMNKKYIKLIIKINNNNLINYYYS